MTQHARKRREKRPQSARAWRPARRGRPPLTHRVHTYLTAGIRLAGATNDVHVFDVKTGKWDKITPLGEAPSPRAAHAAAAVGNMVVVQVRARRRRLLLMPCNEQSVPCAARSAWQALCTAAASAACGCCSRRPPFCMRRMRAGRHRARGAGDRGPACAGLHRPRQAALAQVRERRGCAAAVARHVGSVRQWDWATGAAHHSGRGCTAGGSSSQPGNSPQFAVAPSSEIRLNSSTRRSAEPNVRLNYAAPQGARPGRRPQRALRAHAQPGGEPLPGGDGRQRRQEHAGRRVGAGHQREALRVAQDHGRRGHALPQVRRE